MTTKLERAKSLIGKTILLEKETFGWGTLERTFEVNLVGDIPFDLINDNWSWPAREKYLCIIGQYSHYENDHLISQTMKVFVFKDKFKYKLVE